MQFDAKLALWLDVDFLQAVHAVCNNDYLLVLMDMRLPGMDGITATQEIRKAEQEGRTAAERPCTVIAMTADASPEFKEKVKLPAYHYLWTFLLTTLCVT